MSGAFWGEEKRFICKWKVIFKVLRRRPFVTPTFTGKSFILSCLRQKMNCLFLLGFLPIQILSYIKDESFWENS